MSHAPKPFRLNGIASVFARLHSV